MKVELHHSLISSNALSKRVLTKKITAIDNNYGMHITVSYIHVEVLTHLEYTPLVHTYCNETVDNWVFYDVAVESVSPQDVMQQGSYHRGVSSVWRCVLVSVHNLTTTCSTAWEYRKRRTPEVD